MPEEEKKTIEKDGFILRVYPSDNPENPKKVEFDYGIANGSEGRELSLYCPNVEQFHKAIIAGICENFKMKGPEKVEEEFRALEEKRKAEEVEASASETEPEVSS